MYYLSKELRDDEDVVLEAVKNKGLIVKYASKRLRSQKNSIEAIKQDKRAYDFIVPELREDEEIKNIMNPPKITHYKNSGLNLCLRFLWINI